MKEIALTGLSPTTAPTPTDKAPSRPQGEGFNTYLKQALGEVNDLQHKADQAIQQLASGGQADIQETTIALEKADVSFRLMMQIRNKILDAYQEIIRMQV